MSSLSLHCATTSTWQESQSLDDGNWEAAQFCAAGEVICGMQYRFEPHQGSSGDDTALNGIEFQCCSPSSGELIWRKSSLANGRSVLNFRLLYLATSTPLSPEGLVNIQCEAGTQVK